MFIYYNLNPLNKQVGDCVIRGIAKFLNKNWYEVYNDLANLGIKMADMISSNAVWGAYLKGLGYRRTTLSDACPSCYTVRDFCAEHKIGRYLLCTGDHVVAVENGDYYDTYDSGDCVPIIVFKGR